VLLAQVRSQREKVSALSQRCDAAQRVIERSRVPFPVDARVADVAVSEGSEVREGDVLATVVPSSAQLVGYAVLAETHRSEVEVGQTVQLRFDALPVSEVGAGTARVARVLDALPSGVKVDAQDGGGVVVELGIEAMPRGSGAPRTGMTFGCDVLTRRPTILSLLFASGGG
jgi:multidrug resistance efflux pump